MIANICFNDNVIQRSWRKTSKYCEQCGKPYRQLNIQMDGEKLVAEEIRD